MANAKMLNLEALEARLRRVPEEIRKVAKETLDKEVEGLVEAEKRAAPVSTLEDHPGQLRDGIHSYDTPGRPLSKRVIAGARDSKGRLFGRYVEFGHVAGESGVYVPASPFWFVTYRALRKGIKARLRAGPRKALKILFPKA